MLNSGHARRRVRNEIKRNVASQVPVHLWTKRMKGAISGLALSRSGKQILVATHPDGDIPGTARTSLLSLWSTQGKLLWEQRTGFPIKDFAISAGGELIVLTTYEDELIGLDSRGRRIWKTSGLCKPYVIQDPKRVLCYHDDDSEPQTAFDILDWRGQPLGQFPIQGDVVAFKLSESQKNLAIGLTGGEVVLLGQDFKPLWQKKIDGEVIDLAVSNSTSVADAKASVPALAPAPLVSPSVSSVPVFGEPFKVAVLVRTEKKTQKLIFFNEKGEFIGEFAPSFSAEQLELSPSGGFAYFYGNSSAGQWVSGVSSKDLKELWRQGESSYSRYSGSINLSPGLVWMGVERSIEKPVNRESRVVVFDEAGKKVYDLPLPKDDTAYIFSHRISMVPNWFVVGTDDAKLSVYRF